MPAATPRDAAATPDMAAGIVAFRPEPQQLLWLAARLGGSIERLYVFCNGPLEPDLTAALRRTAASLCLIEAECNLGIGVALNLIATAALLDGFERLILFDQDSRPEADLVGRLGTAFDRLQAAGRQPAALGPRLVAPQAPTPHVAASKAPRYRVRPGVSPQDDLLPVDFLPTSGTLFDLGHLRRTGFFRADYFIDGIDLEWCFRAWAQDASSWLAAGTAMEHTVGTGTIALPFGFRMPNQKPFRMYCHLRNTIYGFRLAHVPWRWKLRQAAYMAVQILAFAVHHRGAAAAVRPLLAGLRDGLRGRLGVPPPDSGI